MEKSKQKIIKLLSLHGGLKPKDLSELTGISLQALHRHLKSMVSSGELIKLGTAPVVFYRLNESEIKKLDFSDLKDKEIEILTSQYAYLEPSGKLIEGVEGFRKWVTKIRQPKSYSKLASRYLSLSRELGRFRKAGLIEVVSKIETTFDKSYLDKLYHIDFWSIPKYGRTKLGHLLTLAKSGQQKKTIKNIAEKAKPLVENLIEKHKIEGIAFAPHSVPRKI